MSSLTESGAHNSVSTGAEKAMEPPGGSIDHPASEEEDLREEQYLYPQGDKGGLRARVLSSFKVLSAGKLVHIDATSLHRQDFSAFEVVGIAATIHGVEGLFSQSAWFGGNDLDWFWARLPKISRIEVREDVRFRGGQKEAKEMSTKGLDEVFLWLRIEGLKAQW